MRKHTEVVMLDEPVYRGEPKHRQWKFLPTKNRRCEATPCKSKRTKLRTYKGHNLWLCDTCWTLLKKAHLRTYRPLPQALKQQSSKGPGRNAKRP